MFCEVIVDIKHDQVNHFFDYEIPESMVSFLMRGMRVIVPFGSQKRLGFVMKIKATSTQATKQIIEILDVIPALSETSLLLVDYLEETSTAPYAQIIETVLPSELLIDYKKQAVIIKASHIPEDLKSKFNQHGIWHLTQSDLIYQKQLLSLKDKGVIDLQTVLKKKAKDKTISAYTYISHHFYKRKEHYLFALDQLKDDHTYTPSDLNDLGLTLSMINTLVKNGVFHKHDIKIDREIKHKFTLKDKEITFTEEQQKASVMIEDSLGKNQTILLKGITGSGKTELYLDVIENVLNKGQTALILVPEIVLIGMMAQRLKSRFSDVIIYHSALSKGERYDQVQKIYHQDAKIILGTRSAIFLPVIDLGIIIIDEAHDTSYQQKEGLVYDAIEIAARISEYHHIPLLLGSATPSINQMYQALNQSIKLVELKSRPYQQTLPKIELVDMRKELKNGHTSMFSKALIEGITERLEKKEQVLILYNRKGYAPFVLCRSCGDVPMCPSCDISLTYYHDKAHLKCHYCGYEKPYTQTCNQCKHETVKPMGVGIEMVEKALQKMFSKARVLRMDANVTSKKGSHEAIWHQFINQEADILLGTQMIAKGLDFPKVTLVGILMADLLLKVPSYRASEQTYMLLTQMSGRSGRAQKGETIIQAYDLDHFAIQSVLNDYDSFYQQALINRKLAGYAPFVEVKQVLFEGTGYLETYQVAYRFKKYFIEKNLQCLGPAPALIKKLRNKYRFNITIKGASIDIKDIKALIQTYQTKELSIKYSPSMDD